MRGSPDLWRARNRLAAAIGLIGSLVAHALVFSLLRWAGTLPAMDFDLQLPSEVEFGVTNATKVEPPPVEPPPQAAVAQPAPAPGDRKSQTEPRPDAPDAGPPVEEKPEPIAQPSVPDAGTAPGAGDRPLLAAYAPEGAQIALRVHLGRVRESELAPDVRRFLEGVADWRLILEGSGLDPLEDLERLYIASPDLKRSSLVIAGQYFGGEEVAQQAVAQLALARGREAAWRRYGAIRVAPWHNLDETERVLALIAPHQFAITRSEDLPRVLQVARALAQRRTKAGARVDAADALLALGEGETLALSVEGARLFARGNLRGIPERLEVAVSQLADGPLDVRASAHFEDAQAAEQARLYWDRIRERYASHPLVALTGMRAPLSDAQLEAEDSTLLARTQVSLQQARVVLGFLRGALAPAPPSPDELPRPAAPPLPGANRPPASQPTGPRAPRTGKDVGPVPGSLSRPDP